MAAAISVENGTSEGWGNSGGAQRYDLPITQIKYKIYDFQAFDPFFSFSFFG
jgi:hypothetical protein